jgi:hypothetical protein
MPRMSNRSIVLFALASLVIAAFTLVSCAGTQTRTTSSTHPEVEKNPICGECHDDKQIMDHNKKWGSKHEFTMNPQKPDCILCHGDIAECGGMCHPS